MRTQPCCGRRHRADWMGDRGLCVVCECALRRPRKEDTLQSAFVVALNENENNLVGATRLLAWAMRRDAPYAGDLRFEQGPAACAALLAGGAGSR